MKRKQNSKMISALQKVEFVQYVGLMEKIKRWVILNQSFDILNEAVNWGKAHVFGGGRGIFSVYKLSSHPWSG